MDICTDAGYTVNAAINNHRIKAVEMVSAVKIGSNYDLISSAASTDKANYVVGGANHMSLYDGENYVQKPVYQLVPLFKKTLI